MFRKVLSVPPYVSHSMYPAVRLPQTVACMTLVSLTSFPWMPLLSACRQLRNATLQWMLGDALMVAPVMTNVTNVITPHFTAGSWYSAWDYDRLNSDGKAVRMEVPLGDVAVHLRGGAIVPMQKYAPVTRDVRTSPVTLLVTLPAAPVQAATQTSSPGPIPPYATEQHCASARISNVGKLVSCGLLYADTDSQDVADDEGLQAWFTAVTEKDSSSGVISSSVLSATPELKGKLRITQVYILGLPKQASATAASWSNAPPPSRQKTTTARTSMEAWNTNRPAVSVSAVVGKHAPQADFDGTKGVLRVTGLDLSVSEPFSINWHTG